MHVDRDIHTVEHARVHTHAHLSLGVGIDPHPSTVGKRLQHLVHGGARGRRHYRRCSAVATAVRRGSFRRWHRGGRHAVGRTPAGVTVLRDQKAGEARDFGLAAATAERRAVPCFGQRGSPEQVGIELPSSRAVDSAWAAAS